jgi:hypothetical protein
VISGNNDTMIPAVNPAADAYARMMQGKARFRMVLVTKYGVAQSAKPAA